MRAVQAVTPVSWMATEKRRHISHFMLLGLQAMSMHCWTHSRRTVFSGHISMHGLFMETAEPAALQDVTGTCGDPDAPLIVYSLVGTRDKGHGGDELVHGMQDARYKCADRLMPHACTE